jgi:hypothetical protein
MILNYEKIILVYQYFKVKNNDSEYQNRRQNEIDLCLIKNNNNKYINEIHLLVEELYELSFLSNTTKIKQIVINKRLSYQDAFEYYNINLSNQICILSNADVYYDDSLNILKYVNFNFKTVLCLTRYEDNSENELKLLCGLEYDYSKNNMVKCIKQFKPSIWTQDCWIWKDNQINIKNCDFHLGIPGCDNHIVYLFTSNNYNIYNPSKLICSNHIDILRNKNTEYGIEKGNYINDNNRIKNTNEYYYLKNISDITDSYTNMSKTLLNYVDLYKIILSYEIIKSITKIDNFNIYTSSDNNIHNSSFISFKNKNNYWNPLNNDKDPYIIISFNQIKNIVILDIRGKTVDRNDRIIGGIESFSIKYIYKDNQIKELDKKFTCINHLNGNFINRFYLDESIECKNLVIYNMKFIGIRTIKIRLWEKNKDTIISNYNNNYKILYFNDYKSWQRPVITEYQIFKNLINNNIIPYNYFAFPWANLIDSTYNQNSIKYRYLYDILQKFENPLKLNFCTIIQHIQFRKHFELYKTLNIKYIFTPHRLISDDILEEKYDIKIIPISLYPVQYNNLNKIIDLPKRIIFASFIGFYVSTIYMSDIRLKIFNIFSKYNDCLIKHRYNWHYSSIVYNKKVDNLDDFEYEYKLSLSQSIFSLCPSGSGPNSIRIWESISYGTIPVILADDFVLPRISDVNYNDCFIFWKESNIENLYKYLKNIDISIIEKMSKKCIQLYNNYFSPDRIHIQISDQLEQLKKFNQIVYPNKYCIHTYLTTCKTKVIPPGFGDFLRGTIALYNYSKKYNYKLYIDKKSHPIFKYFKLVDNYIIDNLNYYVKELIWTKELKYEEINYELEELFKSGNNFSIFTNSYYTFIDNKLINYGDINDECKKFLKNLLIPINSIKNKINYIFKNIYNFKLNEAYSIIHIRLKDNMIDTVIEKDYLKLYNYILKIIKNSNNKKYILMCNYSKIAKQLKESISELYYWDNNKTHLGMLDNTLGIEDTVIDFHIISRSNEIISYSDYEWNSGFSKLISIIYDIKYITVKLDKAINLIENNIIP